MKTQAMVKINDRVRHRTLGSGTIVGTSEDGSLVSIKFRNCPRAAYSVNDTLLILGGALQQLEQLEYAQSLEEVKQKRAQRVSAYAQAIDAECDAQELPLFELNPEHESAVFVLNDANREAYLLLFRIVQQHLAELVASESDKAVFGRVGFDVWAQPLAIDEVVSSLTACGLADARRYVKVGEGTHHIKYNLCLPNSKNLAGLDIKLQTNFPHPRRLSNGREDRRNIQIGKRSLCEQLIRDGILPEEV